MNVAVPASARIACSAEEWALRCDLAALYRLMAHFKWTDLIYTHLSVRVPGDNNHFLINDYRRMFHEMRASDLVKIDLDGNIVDPAQQGRAVVNAAGFCIHSAVHMARHDLVCVMHTHTAAGIAVSAQKHGLLPISQHSMRFYNRIAYHGYEGVALDLDERERLVADLGPHKAMILRNHGLLACGGSIPEAFANLYFLERSCQAQVAALVGGGELVIPPPEVCEHTAKQMEPPPEQRAAHLAMLWESCLRLVENDMPDYRQ